MQEQSGAHIQLQKDHEVALGNPHRAVTVCSRRLLALSHLLMCCPSTRPPSWLDLPYVCRVSATHVNDNEGKQTLGRRSSARST
eukprot:SAG25_NODE_5118_length_700_cov_1.094842_1_plen_83_part_10